MVCLHRYVTANKIVAKYSRPNTITNHLERKEKVVFQEMKILLFIIIYVISYFYGKEIKSSSVQIYYRVPYIVNWKLYKFYPGYPVLSLSIILDLLAG